jgi:hypothetical protein
MDHRFNLWNRLATEGHLLLESELNELIDLAIKAAMVAHLDDYEARFQRDREW